MMPKQLPDMSQDPETKKEAAEYAKSVMNRLKVNDVEHAIEQAYLLGARNGFCVGYRISDIDNEKTYTKIIRELKKQIKNEDNI